MFDVLRSVFPLILPARASSQATRSKRIDDHWMSNGFLLECRLFSWLPYLQMTAACSYRSKCQTKLPAPAAGGGESKKR